MFLKYRLPPIVWTVVILVLTLSPNSKLPETESITFLDKLAHAGVFMIWSFLLVRYFEHHKNSALFHNPGPFLLMGLSGVFGLSIELTQLLLPFRQFEWSDLVADIIGGIAGYYIYRIFVK
jgi:VanZ family protein